MKSLKYGLAAFCLLASTLVFAQDSNDTTAQVVSGTNDTVMDEKHVLTPVEQKMQKLVSVDFRNTPMEDVIRLLAAQADVDIVKSPSVVGNVTATLTNVPLGEALRNILAAHGYAYVADQSLIRIVTKAEVVDVQEVLVNKVYQITYADVREVEVALRKFISPRGSISSNPGTNNIIVTDTESKIRAIDTFIQEIDRMTPQILVEARIYDIKSTDRFDVGFDWDAGRAAGKNDPFINSQFAGLGAAQAESAVGELNLGILNEHIDIDVVLRAQKENIDAKLLANPRILVLDNEAAIIKIISEVPFLQLNQGALSGAFGTIEFKEVGVTLKVIPHLTREGMIRLKLLPEFSLVARFADVLNPNVSGTTTSNPFPVPVIDRRLADTTLLVKDNQTVVLGGLRKKDIIQQINKIPWLGDIPVIGNLFKFTGERTELSEIIVFVTPRLIMQPLATGDMHPDESKANESTQFKGPKPIMTEGEKQAEQAL